VWFLPLAVLKVGPEFSSFQLNQFIDLDIKKPAKRFHKVQLVKDSRRTLTSIRRIIRKQRYRKDLKMVRFIYRQNRNLLNFIS
jgi:hypothetical protein